MLYSVLFLNTISVSWKLTIFFLTNPSHPNPLTYFNMMNMPQLALFLLIFSFLCRCALFSFIFKIKCNWVQKLPWSATTLSQLLLKWKEISYSTVTVEYAKPWNGTSGIWLVPILLWQQTTISFLHSFNSKPHRDYASATVEQPTTPWKYFGNLLFTSPNPSWTPFILLCNLGVVIQFHYGPQ